MRAAGPLLLLAAATTPAPPPIARTFVDGARDRPVPVLLYGRIDGTARPLAILSHGYGIGADAYSFLAQALVTRGYVVASIRHLERPGDPLMATGGDLATLRRPVWQIGADSIGFVARRLRALGIASRGRGLLLVGHSNGGDMAALYTAAHPDMVRTLVTLDNRRMPLPRTRRPRICTLRSADQPADAGVVPDAGERLRFGIMVTRVAAAHADMTDVSTPAQRREILDAVGRCLAT